MDLNADICFRAMMSRDARFDGRFFAAVVTTGVYCRPICPAPKPKRRNVRYYPCAAAAEEAGFRPCMRCRPEASPGTPAWVGTSATVTRALRLISDGYLDRATVADLAERLGIGPRHLRRLFFEHLGAAPVAVAQTRRVHFAKTLVDGTRIPITEVAFCSGFSSVRRFNDAFKKTFGRTPTEVREPVSRDGRTAAGAELELHIPFRPPFDWRALLAFLRPRVIPGVEIVDGGVYRRTVRFGNAVGTVSVRMSPGEDGLLLRASADLCKHVAVAVERTRRLFDLRADPTDITSHLEKDPLLSASVRRHRGLRVPGAWDPYETSVRAILGQQVSVKAATTLAGRIVERYGDPFPTPNHAGLGHLFPSAERLRRARFRRMGMPNSRAGAVRALAAAVGNGNLRFDGSHGLERFVETFTALGGIGPWTAHYVAMRACGEPDALPSGDLALRRAAQSGDPAVTTERRLVERAERWRPWRAYATVHLWNEYARRSPPAKRVKRKG